MKCTVKLRMVRSKDISINFCIYLFISYTADLIALIEDAVLSSHLQALTNLKWSVFTHLGEYSLDQDIHVDDVIFSWRCSSVEIRWNCGDMAPHWPRSYHLSGSHWCVFGDPCGHTYNEPYLDASASQWAVNSDRSATSVQTESTD